MKTYGLLLKLFLISFISLVYFIKIAAHLEQCFLVMQEAIFKFSTWPKPIDLENVRLRNIFESCT